jgi:hypothetical protein
MKYMLLRYANEAAVPRTPEEEQAAAPVWAALAEEVKAAGVWISSSGLSPVADATTVRLRDGKRLITGGPFAETHEQLGGNFCLNVRISTKRFARQRRFLPQSTARLRSARCDHSNSNTG